MPQQLIKESMEDQLNIALSDMAARAMIYEIYLARTVNQLRDCVNVLNQCKPTNMHEAKNISTAKIKALDVIEQCWRIV